MATWTLETVACPLCGLDVHDAFLARDGFNIVRCHGCGLAYVNPRLPPGALTTLYLEQHISPAAYYIRTERQDELSFRTRLRLIERYRPPGTLLDLGCGPGTFSAVARSSGWQTQGIDLNPVSVAYCHDRGLDAVCDGFPSQTLDGTCFDVIVMNDFIEHVPDPVHVLTAARELLAPDGILFVTTPDIGSPVARLFGRHWLHLKPNEHLTYFDRGTIALLLEKTGFQLRWLRSMGRVRNLGVALEKLANYAPLPSRVLQRIIPRSVADRACMRFNPGDEMVVIAGRNR